MPALDINALYQQVRRRLIESGEWDQIRAVMTAKLNESGWIDDMRHRTKEEARNMEALSFQALLNGSSKSRPESIPLAVKREISSLIRQHVEKQFE